MRSVQPLGSVGCGATTLVRKAGVDVDGARAAGADRPKGARVKRALEPRSGRAPTSGDSKEKDVASSGAGVCVVAVGGGRVNVVAPDALQW